MALADPYRNGRDLDQFVGGDPLDGRLRVRRRWGLNPRRNNPQRDPQTDHTARHRTRQLDTELDSYRTVLRNEPDAAATVGKQIAQTTQERRRLQAVLGSEPTSQLTKDDIKALVASVQDITATTETYNGW